MKSQMIVFGEDWGGLPSSTQYIISQMNRHYQITWINSLGLRSPKASWHDVKRVFYKAGRILKQMGNKAAAATHNRHDSNRVELHKVVEPRYLPFPGNSLARVINRRLLSSLLKAQNEVENSNRPVIWISLPNAVDALFYLEKAGLEDAIIIYYCCDDFSALDGVDHHAIARLERELMDRAHVIVATSDSLMEKMPADKSHMIAHGVDTGLFFNPVKRAKDLPLDKPVAGFYGSIAAWLDIDLMVVVAKRLSDWNFVFIGHIQVDVTALSELDNVYFLGAKPHDALPAYSQHWQASLLPFVKNEQIEACNPLKLREYLAAGKPIVATDFPAARDHQKYISIADDADTYADALQQTLVEKPVMWELRRRRVSGESWQAVAGKINALIEAV